jgi:uncharacterized protein
VIDIEEARGYYGDNDTAHGFDHVLRVWRLAERIGREEGADMEVLQAAALLHDIGRSEEQRTGACHAEVGAARAREILRAYPLQRVFAVAQAIAQHRFRGPEEPMSLEARILYDADKLDAIGAIGVARSYAIAGEQRQHLWGPVTGAYAERLPQQGRADLGAEAHTPVHEFRFKLSKLKDQLYTSTGKRLAEERHRVMVEFFAELACEVVGER